MIAVWIFNTLAFLACFPWFGTATDEIKVFTFKEEGINKDTNELSSASVTNRQGDQLPVHFLICSSHKQQQVSSPNTRTIYVMYEDPSFTKPWFSVGFYGSNIDKLWANIKFSDWHDLGNVTRATLLNWVHVCVEVDTVNGTLRASINGGNVTRVNNVGGLNPTPRLYLRLGVVHQSYDRNQKQFLGAVTNINIFNLDQDGDDNMLVSISGSPCNLWGEKSKYLAWSDAKWDVSGEGVKAEKVDLKSICLVSKMINFRIPLLWNKVEATEECKKYGHGKISKPNPAMKNVSNIDIVNMYGELFEQCDFFWTTFTDKYIENTFVDELTNETKR